MSRLLGLVLLGLIAIGLTGCVGPMGAGCRDSCTGCGELYIDPWINHPADCTDPCDSCGNYNGQTCGQCRSIFAGAKSLWGYRCGCDPAPVKLSDRCFAPDCNRPCDGCDSGCDSCLIEPACGCEGPCGCDSYVEPGCGLEPGCGFEPTCGCDGPCDCSMDMRTYSAPSGSYMIEQPGTIIDQPGTIIEPSTPAESGPTMINQPRQVLPAPRADTTYAPSRTRQIFRPRNASNRGFLNEFRR